MKFKPMIVAAYICASLSTAHAHITKLDDTLTSDVTVKESSELENKLELIIFAGRAHTLLQPLSAAKSQNAISSDKQKMRDILIEKIDGHIMLNIEAGTNIAPLLAKYDLKTVWTNRKGNTFQVKTQDKAQVLSLVNALQNEDIVKRASVKMPKPKALPM